MTSEQEIATQPAAPRAGAGPDTGAPAADGSDLGGAVPTPGVATPTRARSTKRRTQALAPDGPPPAAPGPEPAAPLAPVTGTGERPGEDPPGTDPLAKIMLTPRGFGAVLAVVGLLLGLVLALVPVHVAGMDTDEPSSVSCGNTIGGVETPLIARGLGPISDFDSGITAAYVGTCQQAIATRLMFAWPMFFGGMIGLIWLGVVRRESSSAAQ
ncbi:hypothetical protein [Actinophytocola xanthii]|uniref:Uncharacterized protein n=1 Tax=Actinophytocola xanthii TaxID=1912961 RepID=A0A1Q8CTS0_9PSEU|nr:hypothetical protein [Actinophytocola xanthii]OLF17769.1 hypothetical protein BU204_09755 [Actinophytocola xanthii]